MVQKGMVEFGRGGACVPARDALQGRIHRSSPRTMCVFLVWKRRYADVRAGTQAPPLRISFGWITHGWMMPFNGMVQKGMVEFGRGGACVPARVALQGRIHHSFPAHNACVFGMETPLRGRSGGHSGTAPTIPNTYRRSAKMKTRVLMLA